MILKRLFILNALLLALASPAKAEDVLVLGLAENTVSKYASITLTQAYAQLGISIEIKHFPAARSLVEANAGNIDGEVQRIAGIEITYPNLIRIPIPVDSFPAYPYVADPTIHTTDWASLAPYRVGIRTGIHFAEQGTSKLPSVFSLQSYDKLFELLRLGRLDVVIATPRQALIHNLQNVQPKIHPAGPALQNFPLYHLLHTKHASLVPAITRVLQEMQADGKLRKFPEY